MAKPHFTITDIPISNESFIHTRVELYYRDFLEDLDTIYADDDALFRGHIQAIIWGVLYIEGLVNHKLRQFTASRLPKLVSEKFWALTKHSKLEDKIDLVLSIGGLQGPRLSSAMKQFTGMVAERNRLVHFKDSPTKFDLPTLIGKIGPNAPWEKWEDHAPPPKIVKDLFAKDIRERIETFRTVGDALENVTTQP